MGSHEQQETHLGSTNNLSYPSAYGGELPAVKPLITHPFLPLYVRLQVEKYQLELDRLGATLKQVEEYNEAMKV